MGWGGVGVGGGGGGGGGGVALTEFAGDITGVNRSMVT